MWIEHDALRRHWYVVAEAADLDIAPKGVRLLGTSYVVWRDPAGRLVAAPDRCPHREAPLSAGKLENGCVACPYHGWTFGAGGQCVSVPSSGEGRPVPPKAHLATVPVTERYGLVWVCPGEPAGSLPEIRHDADSAFRRINTGVEEWATCALRMTDNFMDISHFPYVHTGTFGIQTQREVPRLDLGPLDDGYFGYRFEVDAGNASSDGNKASGTQAAEVVHRRMSTGFHLPFAVRSTIAYETGLEHILLLCTTPIDEVTSYFTFVVWRNDDFTVPAEEVVAFDRAIGAEDKRMLELVPGVLPFDQQATVSVQSDKASVEWRRQLVAMLDA